jgi:hypothetical protein
MRTQTARSIAGGVNSDGTPYGSGAGAFTSRRTGVGTFVVTFAAGLRLLGFVAMGGSNGFPVVGSVAGNTGSAIVFNSNTQAPTDTGFTFIATVAT